MTHPQTRTTSRRPSFTIPYSLRCNVCMLIHISVDISSYSERVSIRDREFTHVQHPALMSSLRSYQLKAVRWMMDREEGLSDLSALETELKASWKSLRMLSGRSLLYNEVMLPNRRCPQFTFHQYSGELALTYPSLEGNFEVRGGILADEMVL